MISDKLLIDWDSNAMQMLLNPKITWQQDHVAQLSQESCFAGHVWFATSGTSGPPKFVALSKKALLSSAAAVNKHFNVSQKDVWLNVLPTFHVGGVGVFARAHLSGSRVINRYFPEKRWDPSDFLEAANAHRPTLSALVPTQLFDLVKLGVRAPQSLRAVIIGGGALSLDLRLQAQALGWPLYPSYGLTECSSQVATALLGETEGGLHVLNHVSVKIDQEQRIYLKSDALLSAYAVVQSDGLDFIDPKEEGWLRTEDRGSLRGGSLEVFGRGEHFFKVLGENVNLAVLQEKLDVLKHRYGITQRCVLVPLASDRRGHEIGFCHEGTMTESLQALVDEYNLTVAGFERIQKKVCVEAIPQNALGKVEFFTLSKMIRSR